MFQSIFSKWAVMSPFLPNREIRARAWIMEGATRGIMMMFFNTVLAAMVVRVMA